MTQTSVPITTADAVVLSPMSVQRYHELTASGVLTTEHRVELIENQIVPKMSKNPPHALVKRRLITAFNRLLPGGWFFGSGDPVTLSGSEPEPNGVVIRGTVDDYADRHPGPTEVPIIVEIADSSLGFDRRTKRRVYARAGIETYWIVNLVDRIVEIYTHPQPALAEPTYADRQDYAETGTVPVVLDGVTAGHVAVRDLLPPA